MTIKWAVGCFWHRRLACGSVRAIAGPRTSSRTFWCGKPGNLDKMHSAMNPG